MTPSTVPSSATLNMRPGYVDSPTNRICGEPGVMQIEFGAPIALASASPVGVAPVYGRDAGGGRKTIQKMRL